MTDEGLLELVARGDQGALKRLYERYARRLLGLALLRTGDADPAADVVQETMLAVWRGAASYRGEGRVSSWLMGICRRQADGRRMGKAVGGFYLELVSSGIDSEAALEMARDYARSIRQAQQDVMRRVEMRDGGGDVDWSERGTAGCREGNRG